MRGENVPVIFGIKLKQYREEKGYHLKNFAEKAGISPSYLNEIEKGKKYPKTDKILKIAHALNIPYDDLVSLKLGHGLNPLESVLASPMIRELPLQLFGISQHDVIGLITKAPKKAVALIRTLDEISRSYGMQVEHFFYAMLRSYQEVHENFFDDIEKAVEDFIDNHNWDISKPSDPERLAAILEKDFGVLVDEETMRDYPDLASFRSIWINNEPQKILINSRLTPPQKAFQMAREIGIHILNLKERGIASSRAEVTSFEQVLNDFKASYFAGALMINQQSLVENLRVFFRSEKWEGGKFLSIMQGYEVTPEIFLYRLTQIIPKHFNLTQIHFLRYSNHIGSDSFHLTKHFNMSRDLLPTGIGQNEHYCRCWLPVTILKEMALQERKGSIRAPVIGAQIARFMNTDTEYFYLSLARPFALTPDTNTSMTIGFQMTKEFKRQVKFWNDPAIQKQSLNETCERCSLDNPDCGERAAPPSIRDEIIRVKNRKDALEKLLDDLTPGRVSA